MLNGRPTSIILGAACRSPPMNSNAPTTFDAIRKSCEQENMTRAPRARRWR
jgi:hypothetical protein